MNHSDQINELAAALSAAQSEIEGAVKGATNPHFRTKYADLGAVWDAIRDPFTRNGLSITQLPSCAATPNALAIETVLMHKSGQWVSELFVMPVSKADPQGFGSALTYARRYSLMAVAGIAPVDDDAESATDRKPKTEPKSEPAPKTEFTSGPPSSGIVNPRARSQEEWVKVQTEWKKKLDGITNIVALNDWLQDLDSRQEIAVLQDAWPAAADKFNNAVNLKRAVLTKRELAPVGAP